MEIIDTDGMLIANLEEGEDQSQLIDVVKNHPGRQIAVSIGKRITAECLGKLMLKEVHADLQDTTLFTTDRHLDDYRAHSCSGFLSSGECRNPARTTNGLPYRRGKGRSR